MSFWHSLPRPILGLSPMDGVTDAAFRRVVSTLGRPDVIFTEFTNVGDVCRGPDSTLFSFIYSQIERPVVAQLYGKHPELFYQAAHIVCALGFDGLDINMGCPSKNVASSGSGAGLIRTPDVAQAIVRAVQAGVRDWAAGQTLEAAGVKASRVDLIRSLNIAREGRDVVPRRLIPVSVKTRLGYDSIIIDRWISRLLDLEPAAISLHGRTLEQMYRGEADWAAIARAAALVKGTDTLLLGNGDIESLDAAVRRVRETGVDGVLIGRGTLGAPWFFRGKETVRGMLRPGAPAGLAGDGPLPRLGAEALEVVDRAERFRTMLQHAREFEAIFGAARFPRMRKHLGWYCKGFPHAAALRQRMVRASSAADVERFVLEYEGGVPVSTPESAVSSAPAPCA